MGHLPRRLASPRTEDERILEQIGPDEQLQHVLGEGDRCQHTEYDTKAQGDGEAADGAGAEHKQHDRRNDRQLPDRKSVV